MVILNTSKQKKTLWCVLIADVVLIDDDQ